MPLHGNYTFIHLHQILVSGRPLDCIIIYITFHDTLAKMLSWQGKEEPGCGSYFVPFYATAATA